MCGSGVWAMHEMGEGDGKVKVKGNGGKRCGVM